MAESYSDAVESYARDIIENNGLDDSDWNDAVNETVDGSQWIMYYDNNAEVLDASKNEPDKRDVAEMLSKDDHGDWEKVRQTAAFMAMEADIMEKLRDIEDEYFECEDCGAVTKEDDKHEHSDGELCGKCFAKRLKCDIGGRHGVHAVIFHGHEVNTAPDVFNLTGEAETLAVGVINGVVPIGILLDRLTESPHEADTTPETLAGCVNYLKGKYPNGNEVWAPETFLEDDDTDEPVRHDIPRQGEGWKPV